jgi:HAD superfamily hydrolase (TIGR01549 family)
LLPLTKLILILLKDNAYSFALGTMSARNVGYRILDYHKFEDYFNVIMTTGDLANRKPDPETLRKTIDQLDKDVKCTLYVGDADHDLEAGIRLGVPF